MPPSIAIEGPVGVGKTTLVRLMEERLRARIVLDVDDNPFLADFYRDRPAAAFKTQMYFLICRYHQQAALRDAAAAGQPLVCDYLFARDKIFAYLNLDDQEILIYDKCFAALAPHLPKPDLVVYLKAPRDVLLERVALRKIDYEARISEQYMDSLIEAYDHFFYHYKETPLLVVNTSEIDFVQRPEELQGLLQRISAGGVRGVQYYSPVRKRRR